MSETLTLSPELQPKKKFNWFKLMFNAIWVSFLVVVFLLAGRSMWAYWNVYKSIPTDQTEFFAIFDKRSYQSNANWQELVGQSLPSLLGIDREFWEQLMAEDQYYWAVYWENSADIKAKVLIFSYTPLSSGIFERLADLNIPYSYNNQVLLINDDSLQEREYALPDLLIFNNICVGRWQNKSFSCDFDRNAVKVILNDSELRPIEKASPFNLDVLKDRLVYANNQLKLSEISQFLPESWNDLLLSLDDKTLSLVIFAEEHSFFGYNWSIFAENVDANAILEQLQYQLAYQNRQFRINTLADGSRYEDELLNFQIFTWTDESVNGYNLKKLALDLNQEKFLYAYPISQNLILSTDRNFFQSENLFLTNSDIEISKFSNKKIFVDRDLFSNFLPVRFSVDWCPVLKIEEENLKQNFTLCD